LPFVLSAVGGLAGVRETIQDPEMLSLVVPGEIGIFFVIMYAVQALVGIVAQPFIMGVCASGRTEMDGRVGFMVGNIVKRLCTMAWSVTALAAVAWYMNRGVDLATIQPDHVYGDIARAFLPGVMPGLLGLFLASLLASVMSSCDAFMISSSALFTNNIYRPLLPAKSESHYVTVGRVVSLGVVAGGIAFAYWVPDVVTALDIWFRIAPMMGITFWLGLFWRRATAAGAWAATLTGFAVWGLTGGAIDSILASLGSLTSMLGITGESPAFANLHLHDRFVAWLANLPLAESLGFVWQETGATPTVYEPWEIVFYTVAALAVGIVVSLLTKPTAPQKLDTFYTLTRTPIVPGEVITQSCQLPAGTTPVPRKMLLTAGGLEIPVPSRTSVAGFIAGWIAIATMVGGFVWLVG
jgi:Na+/proline symporter